MKINNNLRNIFKIAFVGFIIISCIYVLYFFNNEYIIIENFAGSKDCSNCKMKQLSVTYLYSMADETFYKENKY